MNVNLLVSQSDLDNFYSLADGRQRKPRIDKDELGRLLIDYDKMKNALRSSTSFKVTEPVQKRTRAKLILRRTASPT